VSTVPAMIDAVVAAVRTALPATQVWDGPPAGDEADDRVCVGWSRNRPTTIVTRTDDTFDIETGITERYEIPGLAISYSGDPALSPRRTAVYNLVETIADTITTDAGIKGLNATARVTAGNLTQEAGSNGVQALADFTIHVEAYL
jgi:hypothetical protein